MADLRRAEGIVIKRRLFSNTSLIATVYTDSFGKVRLLAKGALRSRSPFGGKLDLFMRNSVLFYGGRSDLHILKECSLIRAYRGIRESMDRIVAASYLAEILDGLTVDGDGDAGLYEVLERSLDVIEGSARASYVAACSSLGILERLGHFPQYGRCTRCGAALEGARYFDGRAFRCAECSSSAMKVSRETASIIDSVCTGVFPGGEVPPTSASSVRELAALSSRIFACESGRGMRTKLAV